MADIVQIFGKSKCFDTKKAQRFFRERRIPVQTVEVDKYGIRAGELRNLCAATGLEALIDVQAKGYRESLLAYTDDPMRRQELLLEAPQFVKTPIVRMGKKATVGYCPDVWLSWLN